MNMKCKIVATITETDCKYQILGQKWDMSNHNPKCLISGEWDFHRWNLNGIFTFKICLNDALR